MDLTYEEAYARVFSRNPPSVDSKSEFYPLYNAGVFGNRPKTWNSIQEIIESGWTGGICMRSKKGFDRKLTSFDLSIESALQRLKEWENLGITESDITFNQSLPNEKLTIQGEVCIAPFGVHLHYTHVKKPMNLALREDHKDANGIYSMNILKHFLCPESFNDINNLIHRFYGNAVEFSTYSIGIGNIEHRNTLIWEVRNY